MYLYIYTISFVRVNNSWITSLDKINIIRNCVTEVKASSNGPVADMFHKKTKGHSSNCATTYNVEVRQLSLFHDTISHVLRH
jgi:hypothetical protein